MKAYAMLVERSLTSHDTMSVVSVSSAVNVQLLPWPGCVALRCLAPTHA